MKKKQKRREEKAVMFIYGLIIIAFISIIFTCWWAVFRTTMYYSVPYKVVEAWSV